MKVAIVIVVVLVVVLVAAGLALRWRKVSRDHRRERHGSIDRRLLTPPPSPYATSKGFRLLDGEDGPFAKSPPLRPRLESDHDYVFSDSVAPLSDDPFPASLRRDERWALSRSAHRPKVRITSSRLAAIVLVLLLVLGLVGYEFLGARLGPPTSTTSTTTTTIASGAAGPTGRARLVSARQFLVPAPRPRLHRE